MVGGAEGRVVVYCPGQSVGERLQRIVQQPDEGGVCGPGSFRFVAGGEGFGRGIPAVLESGEVAQRDRVQNAGRIRRRTWAGLRYAPSAPSSITKPTDSHKHWYIKRGQASWQNKKQSLAMKILREMRQNVGLPKTLLPHREERSFVHAGGNPT